MSVFFLTSVLMAGCYMFVGYDDWQEVEDDGGTLFLKHKPTFQFEYYNPIWDLETAIVPRQKWTKEQASEFREYCEVRFGLDQADCYQLFLHDYNANRR